jgi:hypothetical protein
MDWKWYLFSAVILAGLLIAAWFVSAGVQRDKDIAEFSVGVTDTSTRVDTVWIEKIRIKTIFRTHLDTVYVGNTSALPTFDTSYVASADSCNSMWRLHLEFASPTPLHPLSAFQNIKIDTKDTVRTVFVTIKSVTVEETISIPWLIATAAVFTGVGFWAGSR